MKNSMQAKKGKITGYGLVMANGMPYIDEPMTVPAEVWNSLTQEQQDFANARVSLHLRRIPILPIGG